MLDLSKLTDYLTHPAGALGIELNPYHFEASPFEEDAKILAVAHCDTVQPLPKKKNVMLERNRLWSPCLDDRLGVYICKDWLWKNNINADILLTNDEEIGASTAQHFKHADKYNWIVEFDRGGSDAVTYGMESEKFVDALEDCGFILGVGSFSDLCFLDTGKCAVNIGVGYYDAHSKYSYCTLPELECNLVKFKDLYATYAEDVFNREYKQSRSRSQSFYSHNWCDAYDDPYDDLRSTGLGYSNIPADDVERCECCGSLDAELVNIQSEGYMLCEDCEKEYLELAYE